MSRYQVNCFAFCKELGRIEWQDGGVYDTYGQALDVKDAYEADGAEVCIEETAEDEHTAQDDLRADCRGSRG